jgi:capsular exopolysaccharide synthesis family protein
LQSAGSVTLSTGDSQAQVTSADVQTYLQLVTSAQVQSQVRAQLGRLPGISAAEVGQTNVIEVTAVAASPADAARIANAYAKAFVAWSTTTTISNLTAAETQLNAQIAAIGAQITRLPASSAAQVTALANQQVVLRGQLAQLEVEGASASTGLELVSPATIPTSPSSPKPAQDGLLGLAVGLLLGIGAAFLRDSLDDTMGSGETVERMSGIPVLASVPLVPSWRKKASPVVVSVSDPTSQPAEAYRSLRTSLIFARQDRPLRTILVTSPSANDGKTATVVNLGAVFAQTGVSVVLVSSDLRRPGLSHFVAPGEYPDFSAVLTGEQPLDRAVRPVPQVDGMWMVGTRAVVANPAELLAGQRMREVVAELAQRFDVVLIDSPPVLPVADAIILSDYVDGVLLVVAAGRTRRAELRRTAEKLAQAGAPVVGAVLNKCTAQEDYGYEAGYQPYGARVAGEGRHGRGREDGHSARPTQQGRRDR